MSDIQTCECGFSLNVNCDCLQLGLQTDRWVMHYFIPFKVIFEEYIFRKHHGLEVLLSKLKMDEKDLLFYLTTNGWGPVPEKFKEYIDSLAENDYYDMFISRLQHIK